MKMNRRYLYILSILLVCVSVLIVSNTYSVFESNASGESDLPIGKWYIRLNDIDISSGQLINFSMNNFVYSDNDHVRDGYIAPGRSGYFDVVLNPTGTDVAIR